MTTKSWYFRMSWVLLALFAVYCFYANLFGVMGMQGVGMYIVLTATLLFLSWGIFITLNFRSVSSSHDRQKMVIYGMIFISCTNFTAIYSQEVNKTGLKWKFKKYDEQLVRMCEEIKSTVPEGKRVDLRKYREFDIWPPGAVPSKQFGYVKKGVVILDFINSNDVAEGIAYNPCHEDFGDDFYQFEDHWYYFRILKRK